MATTTREEQQGGGDGAWLQDVAAFVLFFFPCITLATVGLRIYARFGKKQFGLDDWLICLATVMTIVHTACLYMSVKEMFIGIHVSYIPRTADLRVGVIWNYATQLIYNPILALTKCSVLVFLLRLGGHRRQIRWSIYALLAWNALQMLATFLVVVFQCKPISYFWTRVYDHDGGVCINTAVFYVATAALTIVTDVLVLALPFWVFLGLQMARKTKMALIGVFVMGGIVTVISILRMLWLIDVDFAPLTPDYTYDIRLVYSQVEVCLAIATASAPALRPVFARWFPRLLAATSAAGGGGGGGKSGGAPGAYHLGDDPYGHYGGRSTVGASGAFPLRDMGGRRDGRAGLRAQSPTSSEEEIMTYHGIMRKTDITVQIEKEASSSIGSSVKGEEEEEEDRIRNAV